MVYHASSYRITLFFGPEPVEGDGRTEACVFNVKRRSWRAGIQVSVEITVEQLTALRQKIQLTDRLLSSFRPLAPEDRAACEARLADLFAQAVSRRKLDLRLQSDLRQENGRLPANELVKELDQDVTSCPEYVVAYILDELGLTHAHPSPSSV